MMTRAVTLIALMTLLVAPGVTSAVSPTPITELRVEWEQVSRRGGAVVRGYIYNEHQMRAENVRVRVEQLDADARPVVTRTVFVIGTIPYRDRGYFEVTMPAPGAAYRVSIESFDRAGCGNG
jgi:hypothetical protein